MKKKTATICKVAAMLITTSTLASFVQAGISFADDKENNITSGTIIVQQEEAAYPDLAKITLEQAKDVALANIHGEVLKIELENADGFLVYGVEIVTAEKTVVDVKIDAGNGEILQVERDRPDQNKERAAQEDTDGDHEARG